MLPQHLRGINRRRPLLDKCPVLHLGLLFLGRHKFHHFRVFYRDELSTYIKQILLDSRTLGRPFLRKPVVEEMVRAHVAGYSNYTLEIHKLLTLELAQRQLIDSN